MTPEAQRVAIAEACGWIYPGSTCLKHESWNRWIRPKGETSRKVPDYLADLNAMHEAEKILSNEDYTRYEDILWETVASHAEWREMAPGVHLPAGRVRLSSPTAAQRAEAFLRTFNLWKD